VIRFFLNPFNIFWLLLAASLIALILKNRALSRYIFYFALGWFLLISTPFIPVWLLNSLEDRFHPLDVELNVIPEAEYRIVVLGGGHGFDDRLPPNSLLSNQALARLNEGIRLHRQIPESKLVLSGYSASGRTTQAEMLQKTAILLGVEANKILLQKEPANTWQEAEMYNETFGNGHNIILVTCASHMYRAVRAFEHFGTEVTPSPACYRILGDPLSISSWLPSTTNIDRLRVALFEYSAILRDNYRIRIERSN